jgi:hypothetical protein
VQRRLDRVPVPPNDTSAPVSAMREGEELTAAFLARGDRHQFQSGGHRGASKAAAQLPAGGGGRLRKPTASRP